MTLSVIRIFHNSYMFLLFFMLVGFVHVLALETSQGLPWLFCKNCY